MRMDEVKGLLLNGYFLASDYCSTVLCRCNQVIRISKYYGGLILKWYTGGISKYVHIFER